MRNNWRRRGLFNSSCLITFFDLDVKKAIGTSLAILTINAFAGIHGDIVAGVVFDWSLLLFFTALALLGLIVGMFIGSKLQAKKLRNLFGIFTLFIGISILIKEFISLFSV
ncbi:TSUP family transporter [Legionella gresilensis]|uniref:TSUP family transporter n=1 Tax=Legionella gresilensis TaxID=91823 RepID=UPI001041A7CD